MESLFATEGCKLLLDKARAPSAVPYQICVPVRSPEWFSMEFFYLMGEGRGWESTVAAKCLLSHPHNPSHHQLHLLGRHSEFGSYFCTCYPDQGKSTLLSSSPEISETQHMKKCFSTRARQGLWKEHVGNLTYLVKAKAGK